MENRDLYYHLYYHHYHHHTTPLFNPNPLPRLLLTSTRSPAVKGSPVMGQISPFDFRYFSMTRFSNRNPVLLRTGSTGTVPVRLQTRDVIVVFTRDKQRQNWRSSSGRINQMLNQSISQLCNQPITLIN